MRFKGLEGTVPHQNVPKVHHPWGGEEGREGNKGLIMRITELRYMYYAPINVMPVGGGGRAWGGDLIVFVVPGVGHLTDLVLPGEGIFESFFARRGDI